MTTYPFNSKNVHSSWQECLASGLEKLDPSYITSLSQSSNWLPGPEKIFNAFSMPLENVNYVLFGESPYPRQSSANGYAFWDADVHELWSPSGLSKKVNRATSLRNILKMLLVANGLLDPAHTTQEAISRIDKKSLIQTNDALFKNLLDHGFLLLNATLILNTNSPQQDARAWQPFLKAVLECLLEKNPKVTFILLGRIATTIDKIIPDPHSHKLYVEHPYNLSFITNPKVLDFFRPFKLLKSCYK